MGGRRGEMRQKNLKKKYKRRGKRRGESCKRVMEEGRCGKEKVIEGERVIECKRQRGEDVNYMKNESLTKRLEKCKLRGKKNEKM